VICPSLGCATFTSTHPLHSTLHPQGIPLSSLSYTIMRRVLIASLLAGLAGNALSHRTHSDSSVKRRKTLGFGPDHPHAVFHSSPYQIQTNGFMPMSPKTDPFMVADIFAKDILGSQLSDSISYRIRKDSYTDKNTGVSHVYLRQVVNGIEVSDGDMNINVKDGMVISYGSSVSTPLGVTNLVAH
jgi:extracellular elastinolytic metalloproteinase